MTETTQTDRRAAEATVERWRALLTPAFRKALDADSGWSAAQTALAYCIEQDRIAACTAAVAAERAACERAQRERDDADDALAACRSEAWSLITSLACALMPFANLGKPEGLIPNFHDLPDDYTLFRTNGDAVVVGDVRAARRAILAIPDRARGAS